MTAVQPLHPSPNHFPDSYHQQIWEASGHVSDKRRFVAFVYVLLRDATPSGVFNQVVIHALANPGSAEVAKARADLRIYPMSDNITPHTLVDAPTDAMYLFLAGLKAKLGERVLEDARKLIPQADDVETFFANGWIARYAGWVFDQLMKGTV